MKRFQKIGVYLTGAPTDQPALSYAGVFAKLAGAQKVLCVYEHGGDGETHVDIPDPGTVRQHVMDGLPAEVHAAVDVQISEGAGITDVLRSARDLELDLLIKGRRAPSSQLAVGSLFTRLARKSPCSVLVVPNFVHTHISRVLVPVDMSEHARIGMEVALEIARAGGELGERPQVLLQNVFTIGYGYSKTGQTMEEAARHVEGVARDQMAKFLENVDTRGVEFETIYACSERVAACVHDMAWARKMDLIVIGSRGLSRSAAAILGGTAEQILLEAAVPVLVVKKKGETVQLLNVLLGAS